MKEFKLKNMHEISAEQQGNLIAGTNSGDCGACSCGCSCNCCRECNDSGIDGATQNSTGNTKSSNKWAGD